MREWEAHYQAGDTPWDHGGAAPPLLEMIERYGVELWGGGPVLVHGCGSGHGVRAIAESGVPAIGLDIAKTAVTKAGAIPCDVSASYEHGDFPDGSSYLLLIQGSHPLPPGALPAEACERDARPQDPAAVDPACQRAAEVAGMADLKP